jgi:putative membrane protein
MVMLSDSIMGSKFDVNGFWNAMLFAIVVAILEMLIGKLRNED